MAIDFDDTVLVASIDTVLSGVLGEVYRDSIYLDLLNRFSVAKENLPQNLVILSQVLEENFGQITTKAIAKAIAKHFYSQLGINFIDNGELSLENYIAYLKNLKTQKS